VSPHLTAVVVDYRSNTNYVQTMHERLGFSICTIYSSCQAKAITSFDDISKRICLLDVGSV